MLKAIYREHGPDPAQQIEVVPFTLPVLSQGEVLLEVLAAPINPSDLLMITGDYKAYDQSLPAIGGNVGVGRVAARASGATQVEVGQTVLLPIRTGTWRTHMIASSQALFTLPNHLDPREVATLSINATTAFLLLDSAGDLREGDWVIHNAANSDVGKFLRAVARNKGLRLVNVVRRESAVAEIGDPGPGTIVVDGEDLRQRVREATGGAPIKLGLDAVGGEATQRLASCLARGSTLTIYGCLSMEPHRIHPEKLIFDDIRVQGFWLSRWYETASMVKQKSLFFDLLFLVSSGEIRADIAAEYDLPDIREAIRAAMQTGRNGKVLIVPKHPSAGSSGVALA